MTQSWMPDYRREVVMVASENDALKGGKVGGVGDVVRDLPGALARLGWRVTVIIPSYGFLHKNNPARLSATVRFPFAGSSSEAEIWEVKPDKPDGGVTHLLLEHPGIRGEPIYFHDPPEQTFAQDGTKYALFCSAVGRYLLEKKSRPVLHLHDWHTGALLLLRELHPDFAVLKEYRTVFTIHNLAIQGTRPLRGKEGSVEGWFPELFRNLDWISRWKDPRYPDPAFTPMAAGIRYADKVNTVSPTYAREILSPSDPAAGFVGGEGLESLLADAGSHARLFGILNGCEYPTGRRDLRMSFADLCGVIREEIAKWKLREDDPVRVGMMERLETIRKLNPSILLTSITRVVEQKVRLLMEEGSRGTRAIDDLLQMLPSHNGVFILLGSGTPEYEAALQKVQLEHERFLFLRGYSELIGDALYSNGSMFLMPSLFEPCGISQMVAMRDGQPCIVHAVGGLKDTVIDRVNGFQFTGGDISGKVDNVIKVTGEALRLHSTDPRGWKKIATEAGRARFTWESSARQYVDLLYT